MMQPNSRAAYIDANTGALLATDDFIDPELHWCAPRCKCGCKTAALHLHQRFSCGTPLASWQAANPRPA